MQSTGQTSMHASQPVQLSAVITASSLGSFLRGPCLAMRDISVEEEAGGEFSFRQRIVAGILQLAKSTCVKTEKSSPRAHSSKIVNREEKRTRHFPVSMAGSRVDFLRLSFSQSVSPRTRSSEVCRILTSLASLASTSTSAGKGFEL